MNLYIISNLPFTPATTPPSFTLFLFLSLPLPLSPPSFLLLLLLPPSLPSPSLSYFSSPLSPPLISLYTIPLSWRTNMAFSKSLV